MYSEPIVREPSTGEIPIFNGTVPNTSSAVIKAFYAQLNMDWEISSQLSLLDGTPYTRRFSSLSFPSYNDDRLDYITLPAYDEVYKGSAYFQLTSRFIETEYYSSNTATHNNFNRWEVFTSHYNQEVIYSTEVLSTVRWDRPSLSVDISSTTGGLSGPSCSTQFPITAGTSTTTGTSAGFLSATTTSNNGQTTIYTCKQWQSLNIPFSLMFAAGKAIGVSVISDGSYTLKRKLTPSSSTWDDVSGSFILMTKPYLEIDFSATSTSPTYVEITTYGKELWRSFRPFFLDIEPEVLVHPDNTPFSSRLRPPGISVNDNFWNNNPNLDPFLDFNNRQLQGTGVFL